MKDNLLPNKYQKIGLILGIISILVLIPYYFDLEFLISKNLAIKDIFKNILLTSILLIAFSKEKHETDQTKKIRLDSLKRAILFGGLILILESVLKLILDSTNFGIRSGYEIMVLILLFYLIIFKEKVLKLRQGTTTVNRQ